VGRRQKSERERYATGKEMNLLTFRVPETNPGGRVLNFGKSIYALSRDKVLGLC
jgi:hypothetical protein